MTVAATVHSQFAIPLKADMSLRTRILVLFATLAIAPLITVAGFAYVQSRGAFTELVQRNVDAAAAEAATELAGSFESLHRQLAELAASASVASLATGDAGAAALPQAADEPWLQDLATLVEDGFSSVAIRRADGELLHTITGEEVPEIAPEACLVAAWGSDLTLSQDLLGGDGAFVGRVSGTVSLATLFDRQSLRTRLGGDGTTVVLDRTRDALLHVAGCDAYTDAAELLASLGEAEGRIFLSAPSGRYRFRDGGQERVAAFVNLDSPAWTVVVTAGMADFLGPFRQLQSSYALFVLLVAFSTALAFSLLINRFMRSLEELSAAADRIGEGELNPWLPPPGEDEVGRLSLAIGRMADRIRRMMQHIDRNSRMAVIGELASHLAHEIRNPLSSIKLNLQSLSREVDRGDLPEDTAGEIEICLREVGRLERVVSSVLQLGRSRPPEITAAGSLHTVIEEAVELVGPELTRHGITVETRLEAKDTVSADMGQLKGVFLNLFLNAADAMPTGGTLRVWSVNADPAKAAVEVHVADDGSGIPPAVRDRIFEPFFTTKPDGSGIGLSVALRTVEDHGGRLYFDMHSELDAGTEFVVELPLSQDGDESEAGAPEAPSANPEPSGSGGGSSVGPRSWLPRSAPAGRTDA
jgi:signal transduction histidine kinase